MEPYITQDLDLIITLKALGFRWIKVTTATNNTGGMEGTRVAVTFENSPQLESAINKFHLGELRVEPSDLLFAHRAIKKMVREVTHG
jgi:hypothetical protein